MRSPVASRSSSPVTSSLQQRTRFSDFQRSSAACWRAVVACCGCRSGYPARSRWSEFSPAIWSGRVRHRLSAWSTGSQLLEQPSTARSNSLVRLEPTRRWRCGRASESSPRPPTGAATRRGTGSRRSTSQCAPPRTPRRGLAHSRRNGRPDGRDDDAHYEPGCRPSQKFRRIIYMVLSTHYGVGDGTGRPL